jgi:DNA-binding transcriptional ArsR family regulator
MAIYAADALSLTFQALADPTRRGLLARLASGDADVSELMKPFELSQPTISKHLKVLERAGLVVRGRDAQRRPRTLMTAPLQDVDRWLDSYRRSWEAQFAALDDYLASMQEKKGRGKSRAHRTRQSADR